MRTTREKLIEFVIGVIGGTLLIAGLLSLNSGSSLSRVWIVIGGILIIAGQLYRRRSTS
jgi:hypothetical protein